MALAETVREIKSTQTIPLVDSEVVEVISGMPEYERDSIIRLEKLKHLLFHVGEEPWTLLQTPHGDLTFDEINYSLRTREGVRNKPVMRSITYQQFFRIAQNAGTDVRGIARAFSQRTDVQAALVEEELRRLDEIAEQPIDPVEKEDSHMTHVIRENHSAVYHGILY